MKTRLPRTTVVEELKKRRRQTTEHPSVFCDTCEIRFLYNELIMAVAKKFPGETRHQTALKYIQAAETPSTMCGQAVVEVR